MKTIKIAGLLVGLLAVSGAMADRAGYPDDSGWDDVDFRQLRQQRRIEHGIEAGLLTHREIKKLKKQQRRIARLEYRFKRDGRLSCNEAAVLQRKLDKASRTIQAFKHIHRVDAGYRGYRHSTRYPGFAESSAGARSEW